MSCRAVAFLLAAGLLASFSTRTPAQPKATPPTPPPQFPTLTSPTTLGLKAGASAEVTLTGTNLLDAVGVLTTAPGVKGTVAPNQKDAGKLAVKLEATADAPIGLYQLRVVTKYGVSNFRPLCVDELPEIAEKGGNTKRETAQPVTAPCVIAGTADADASDFYKVAVRPGQRLAFEVLGRRLGSQLDPVLILWDAKAGRELPGLYADDSPGCQSDARVTHTFKDSADIVVEVRDTTYRGGGDFGYRLRIADAPTPTTAFPLAVPGNAVVGFAGLNPDGVKPVKLTNPTGPAVLVRPKRDGGATGWPLPVRVADFPAITEVEPNNDAKTANLLPVPGGVSARFATKGDLDFFVFPGKKGQKLELTAAAYELNAPTEVYLRVLDAKGAELAKSDPAQPLARAEFTPPADGDFYVAAEHLNYQHGPHEVYFLTVKPVAPDFEVTLGLDRVEVLPGVGGRVPVTGLTKKNGFNAPVELKVVGDGLDGSITLPAGANPTPAAPLYLPVTAKAGTKGGVRFQATATAAGRTRWASAADIVKAGMGNLPNPPPEFAAELAAVVVEQPLFELTLAFDKTEFPKGGTLKGKLTAKRAAGFADEITPAAVGLPANVTAKLKPIAKDKTEAEVELTAAGNAAAGPVLAQVRGTAKPGGREFAYSSPPLTVVVAEPKKEPAKKDEKKPEKK